MCGRYTVKRPERLIEKFFPKKVEADLQRPRYNIAPTQNVPTLFVLDGQRVLKDLRWGLVPS